MHTPRGRLDRRLRCRHACRMLLRNEFSAVREALASASQALIDDSDRAVAVHAYRRGLKRLQAARSLMRDAFPHSGQAAAIALREAKAALAGSRAHDALAILLEEICGASSGAAPQVGLRSGPVGAHDAPDALLRAAAAVDRAERAMSVSAGAPIDWHSVAQRAARAWDAARQPAHDQWLGRGDEWLHETRKRFQRCADQIAALGTCAGRGLERSRRGLRAAAESLGRARDLGILSSAIDRSSPEGSALALRADALRAKAVRAARRAARKALEREGAGVERAVLRRVRRSG